MTKAQRERAKRAATVIAASSLWQRPVKDDDGERWDALRHWRGDSPSLAPEVLEPIRR